MKTHYVAHLQKGFFDLGLSIVILLVSGSVAYLELDDENEQLTRGQYQQELQATVVESASYSTWDEGGN